MIAFLFLSLLLWQSGATVGETDPISYTFLKLIREASRGLEESVNPQILDKLDSLTLSSYDKSDATRSGQLEHQESGPRPQVSVKSGLVIGETVSGSHAFYSIPYGKAPIGPLRFMAPVPAEDFTELDASLPNYRMCWQIKDCDENEPSCRDPMSEDCLVLNVNVPENVNLEDSATPPSERLPVLVWFHGGFFFRGRSTTTKYDGRWLSPAINAIVVTVNYRLGPLGFLSFEDDIGFVEGNQGLKDQQLALRWVQENIEKFGGDKNRVTIFSNSAGSQSVNFHLVSQVSDPLFYRGLTQSGAAIFLYQTPQESITSVTSKVLDYIGCTGNPNCLRSATAEDITYSRNSVMAKLILEGDLFGAIEPFRPVIDGIEFIDQPLNLFKNGEWQSHKEFLLGFNQDELAYISTFFQDLGLPMPKVLFEKINTLVLGTENGEIINGLYDERLDLDLSDNLADELTDLLFVCPNRAIARFASQTSTNPNTGVYFYNNAYALSEENCMLVTDFAPVCGNSYHSSEQVFVFKSAEGYETSFSPEDVHMSDVFSAYWGNFASSGDPSSKASPIIDDVTIWPAYKMASTPSWENIRLEYPSSTTQSDYRGKYCDVWDQIGYQTAFRHFSGIKTVKN